MGGVRVTGDSTDFTVAMFATHWSPNGANEITTMCSHCARKLGVTHLPGEPWRPYTRVVVNERTRQGMRTDISHWCPPCWETEGRAIKERKFPAAEFTELEVPR